MYNINYFITIGDFLAIPFFLLLCYYFYLKKNKTFIEKILFLFSLSALIVDTYFTMYKLFFSRFFM